MSPNFLFMILIAMTAYGAFMYSSKDTIIWVIGLFVMTFGILLSYAVMSNMYTDRIKLIGYCYENNIELPEIYKDDIITYKKYKLDVEK